ncbi:unnamed protein product [Lathyrus oleraceus]
MCEIEAVGGRKDLPESTAIPSDAFQSSSSYLSRTSVCVGGMLLIEETIKMKNSFFSIRKFSFNFSAPSIFFFPAKHLLASSSCFWKLYLELLLCLFRGFVTEGFLFLACELGSVGCRLVAGD